MLAETRPLRAEATGPVHRPEDLLGGKVSVLRPNTARTLILTR